jgi:hypothetical protein
MDSLNQNKKAFSKGDESKPEYLSKSDEIVYSKGRRSFDDVRSKMMRTEKQRFVWAPKFDEKKLDYSFDKNPLKRSFSFFTMGLFAFAMIMMISALTFFYYSFTTGGYTVRQDKIILSLEIPTLTSAGQDISGQLVVGNENRTIFKDAYVTLETVEHPGEPAKILSQIQVGDVDVGNKIYKNVLLNLSGLEGEKKIINAVLYYKIPQTESTFQKTISQEILITKSPVTMSVTGPQSLSVNQDGEYIVSVRGISKVIPALLLVIDIPKYMKILKTNFPEVAKNTYSLGPINEGDERVFKFTGSFKDAQELGDKFTIKVKAGSGEDGEVKAFFSESTYGINLAQNPIKLEFIGEGGRGDKLAFTGKQPKISLVVTNTGNVRVKDADMEIKFSGGLLVPKAVSIDGANYDAATFTAKADGTSNLTLKEIDPGAQIVFPIEFTELAQNSSVSGRSISVNVAFTSNTEDSEGKPTTQRVSTTLTPKEGSTAGLYSLYFSGAFKNFGPMPPQVGSTTSYTINLGVNTNSGFTGGKFILPLASNVKFLKALDNSVTYNKDNKTITWNVGTLSKSTSTAFGVSQKDTSIQVTILPTPDQARNAPTLTNGARFEATQLDKTFINLTVPEATINISRDPKYELNKGYDSVGE